MFFNHNKCKLFFYFLALCFSINSSPVLAQSTPDDVTDYVKLSQDFLLDLKEHNPVDNYISALASAELETLKGQLDTDAKRYAFWLNVYNANIQVHLREKPEYYEDRRTFFKLPLLTIGGQALSFADIEHGILRRSQIGIFLGYLSNPFPGKLEKMLRVDNRDYRIHFALNCGAKSCPPVGIYNAKNIDAQLDKISALFLQKFSTYDEAKQTASTTSLFSWFRGDFGSGDSVKKILLKYEIIPHLGVSVFASPYDWTLYLDNFVDI
jgi:hypothetical protein